MTIKERVQYLANILCVIYVNATPTKPEEHFINKVARQLGGKASEIALAFELFQKDDFSLQFPFRYSYQIRNFEDMMRVALLDRKFEIAEQVILKSAIKELELSKEQVNRMYQEAKLELCLAKPA